MFVDEDYVDSRSNTATNNKTVCVYVFARSHDELVNRWKDHFQAVLNCPEPTTTFDMDDTQASEQLPVSVDPISVQEAVLLQR